MQCKTCGAEMIQKSRLWLFVVGFAMIASTALAIGLRDLWLPGVILAIIGMYLVVWATLGKGSWCRNCKRFNI